ncbi:MAG: hypothetical protein HY286_07190 [Planctomycetes bacterium]|nr:hypothetical protein [Planctomycetota bacterium]
MSLGFVMLTLTYTTDLGCTTSANCTFHVYADSDGDGVPDVCEPMCSVFLTEGVGTQGRPQTCPFSHRHPAQTAF